MANLLSPRELAGRIRRDVERSVLRARNGIKMAAGVDRPGIAQTPKDTVWTHEKLQLWRYRAGDRSIRPPILLVMSLVSKSYIYDLRPGSSFVEFLTGQGFDVFLLDWGIPDELESKNTLETYADDYLPRAIDAVVRVSGCDEVTLFGYCFGGVLSLLYAGGHTDGPIRNLAVMATPIDFQQMGPMSSLIQEGRVDPEDMFDDSGNVPAEAMADSFRLLQPTANVSSYVTLWENLWNDQYVESYQTINQWGKDQIPFPGAAFKQTCEMLNRKNDLLDGKMYLGGREIDLAKVRWPFLSIVAERDHIAPIASVVPIMGLIGSEDKEELRLPAGHVGLIVGRTAAKVTMPAMADWIRRHSEEPAR
jgi:polyhydroxyalkanoate synthase